MLDTSTPDLDWPKSASCLLIAAARSKLAARSLHNDKIFEQSLSGPQSRRLRSVPLLARPVPSLARPLPLSARPVPSLARPRSVVGRIVVGQAARALGQCGNSASHSPVLSVPCRYSAVQRQTNIFSYLAVLTIHDPVRNAHYS